MRTTDFDVAVVGAGVVGSACTLALARRGAAVTLIESEPEPGFAASGSNSGILHTGFDSAPGELETDLILHSAELRRSVLEALEIPVLRCGAELHPRDDAERQTTRRLADNAEANGVEIERGDDDALVVPGESATDPIAFTRGLTAAAQHAGATLRTGERAVAIERRDGGLAIATEPGVQLVARVVVNCAGLHADEVARLAGDDSFEIYPRKGEFLVFDPPAEPLDRILLPIPTKRTKGVLVFPTVDGQVVAGPTAVDGSDKDDWSVRPEARDEILPKAVEMLPALDGREPIAAYAGLRPAGRGVNYLIGSSAACEGLVNVAAIRSTGLTASLGIAERVCGIVESLGLPLGPPAPLEPAPPPDTPHPWWRTVAEHRVQ